MVGDGGNTRIEDESKAQAQPNNEYYAYEQGEYGPEDTGVELTEIRIKKAKPKK